MQRHPRDIQTDANIEHGDAQGQTKTQKETKIEETKRNKEIKGDRRQTEIKK